MFSNNIGKFRCNFLTDVLVSVCVIKCASSISAVMDIQPNTIHMAWQIPQYFLMTAGEVVFSVTGLEFSYSQVEDVFMIYLITTIIIFI